MHWGEKCCFCINVEIGCILLGVAGFLTSFVMAITSGLFMTVDPNNPFILGLAHSERIREAILITAFSAALLGLLPNILLVVGVMKKRPGFLLLYFSFGIFYEIFIMICALQFLLQNQWIKSLVISIVCLIYIRYLMMVHTVYESMQNRQLTKSNSQQSLVEDSTISGSFASQETVIADI